MKCKDAYILLECRSTQINFTSTYTGGINGGRALSFSITVYTQVLRQQPLKLQRPHKTMEVKGCVLLKVLNTLYLKLRITQTVSGLLRIIHTSPLFLGHYFFGGENFQWKLLIMVMMFWTPHKTTLYSNGCWHLKRRTSAHETETMCTS